MSAYFVFSIRDVNSREIAFLGRESQFLDLDLDSRFHPSRCSGVTRVTYFSGLITVGSPAGAQRGGGDRRPRTASPAGPRGLSCFLYMQTEAAAFALPSRCSGITRVISARQQKHLPPLSSTT